MNNRKRIYFLSLLSLICLSCAAFQRDEKTGDPIDPRVRAEQEGEIQKADSHYAAGYYTVAQEEYASFQKKFPNSIYFQRAGLGLGQSLEAQDKWSEAATVYRQTIDATRERQPEIAALALYRISLCYENLGDEARVLASLKDALSLKQYLKPEQAQAEIPARMAASYSRMGLENEAQAQLSVADAAIQQIIKQNRSNMDQDSLNIWSAAIYYRMGLFSTNQLSGENLQACLDSFKMIQIFSLRSIELGAQFWSEKAEKALMLNYQDVWKAIQNFPPIQGLDVGAAARQKVERQIYFTGQTLSLISELKSARSASQDSRSKTSKLFFKWLAQLEIQMEKFLYDQGELNQMTPEAIKRNQLKQKIKLEDPNGH
jgi:tetratricopeptide (TPR) repeat protein